MSIEKGKISGLQLTFLLTALIQGSILTGAYITRLAKHDSWLVVLSGLAVIIPFTLVYISLAKMFPGMNLIQIHDAAYGIYLGKVVSILYIFYFLMVLSFNFRFFGDYCGTFLMPDTPLTFFLVVFSLGCAYAVWKGLEVLARVSHFVVVLIFFIIISTSLLLLPNLDYSNFLPVFELPLKNFLQGTHIIAAIPFGEIFIFLTFAGAVKDTKHIGKNAIIGLLLAAVGFLVVVLRNTAVLGNTEAVLSSPSFQSARLVDIGNIFTRIDIVIGIGLIVAVFFKVSIFYYAVVASLAQFLRLKTYFPLILPVGGIAVLLAITDWQSSAEAAKQASYIAPIFITPFLFIFPLLTLFIAKIRNLLKR